MMKVALVLSDISLPPREGLHYQSMMLARTLAAECDLTVVAFVRDRTLSEVDLTTALGAHCACVAHYSGGQLANSVAPAFRGRKIVEEALISIKADIILLDGALACSLADRMRDRSFVMNFVDPGSRRFERLSLRARSSWQRLAYRLAASGYGLLEKRLVQTGRPLVFVSESDVSYMKSKHPLGNIVQIPIMLPSISYPQPPERSSVLSSDVLIYVDGRARHGREALLATLRELSECSNQPASVRVMARIPEDGELLAAGGQLEVTFLPWVDDQLAELSSAGVTVLPDQVGTGLKNRTIEALVWGRRVLATDVALEGLGLTPDVLSRVRYLPGSLGSRLNCQSGDGFAERELSLSDWLDGFSQARVKSLWMRVLSFEAFGETDE